MTRLRFTGGALLRGALLRGALLRGALLGAALAMASTSTGLGAAEGGEFAELVHARHEHEVLVPVKRTGPIHIAGGEHGARPPGREVPPMPRGLDNYTVRERAVHAACHALEVQARTGRHTKTV